MKKLLTREMIEEGAIGAIVARDAPTVRILTDEERAMSLRNTLTVKPRDDVWLFGYGSLIWNPTIDFSERRVAKVVGWHRSFCLATPAGRGSIDNPGLVLGLEVGGDCTGVAFRIAGDVAESELATIWKREMVAASYIPRWLDLLDEQSHRFGCGLAFTIDPAGENYAGELTRDQIVARLATARGALGSSADYLFETCKGLREHAIDDIELNKLEAEVSAHFGPAR